MLDLPGAVRGHPYAYAQAGEGLGAGRLDHGLESVVSARAAFGAQSKLARRQVDVVAHDKKLVRRQPVARLQVAYRRAAAVDIGARLDQRHGAVGDNAFADYRRAAPPLKANGMLSRQRVDAPKAGVVAGGGVLCAGVAQADDCKRRRFGMAIALVRERV